jgi:hypothetical protein
VAGSTTALLALAAAPAVMGATQGVAQAASGVHVQYKTTMTGASAYESEPWFDIVNGGSSSVPLSQVSLRYYFTADTASTYVFACAWAVVGCSNITGTVVAMQTPTATADHYLQLTFSAGAGSLAAGASTQDIQARLYRHDWQNVNQGNDYSFNASMTSYTDWTHVAAYVNGALAWGNPPDGDTGTPPGSPTPTPTPTTTPPATGNVLFDDFNYSSASDPKLAADGWTPRTTAGGPGVSGATWSPSAITFPSSSAAADGHVMQLTASTDGTSANTVQAEIDTTQRKFQDGTYAARVYFNDAPDIGPTDDHVNETFYSISPDDSLYSELDFEYLPHNGWGASGPVLYTTTWYSADAMDRQDVGTTGSLQGWHTLVMTVANGVVTYYLDGNQIFSTTGKYYPRENMTIDFNEWFIDGELASTSTPRNWTEQVDWVYYAQNQALSPSQVDSAVIGLRANGTSFKDTVPSS